jgi:hypothetical protein
MTCHSMYRVGSEMSNIYAQSDACSPSHLNSSHLFKKQLFSTLSGRRIDRFCAISRRNNCNAKGVESKAQLQASRARWLMTIRQYPKDHFMLLTLPLFDT